MASRNKKQSTNSNRPKMGEVRLIGGTFRGRKLPVLLAEGLRPTSDRVRETLFNWLQFNIAGACCLDCFAGSGALGFEALSRGAASVTLLDKHAPSVAQLKANAAKLKLENAEVILNDTLNWLESPASQTYDIVFVDPPFHQGLMTPTLDRLFQNGYLTEKSWLYLEQEKALEWPTLPGGWVCHREKSTSEVRYGLFMFQPSSKT